MYYPLFLELRTARCLVVGGGGVGLRKATSLLEAGARDVLVLDPQPDASAWEKVRHFSALRLEQRTFVPDDLPGCTLVFACTPDRAVNADIARQCADAGILCNCADAPLEGNFIVPASARQGDLTAAVSTGGGSPAWARVVREELELWLVPRAAMSTLMGRLRPHVLALEQNTVQNTALFRTVAHSALPLALQTGDTARCTALLEQLLPEALHPIIGELLYDLV